jgi:YD repeat-containing protein
MVWWFDWELYDSALDVEYYLSTHDLARDQNWRYYAYDWDAQGKWSKRFINDDAKRRFLAREKRKTRGRHVNVP